MKTIKIRPAEGDVSQGTVKVLSQLLNSPIMGPQGPTPMSPDDMRKRIKILDILEAAKPGDERFQVEDADYEILKSVVDQPTYLGVNRKALEIIDDVLGAQHIVGKK